MMATPRSAAREMWTRTIRVEHAGGLWEHVPNVEVGLHLGRWECLAAWRYRHETPRMKPLWLYWLYQSPWPGVSFSGLLAVAFERSWKFGPAEFHLSRQMRFHVEHLVTLSREAFEAEWVLATLAEPAA